MNRNVALIALLLVASLAAAQDLNIPTYEELKYPPIRQIELPDVDVHTLPNGMKLYLLEDHELPLIGGFALVRTGNLFDPPDKVGLSDIVGEVMRSGGTAQKSGDDIDVELENIAASVESGIGETSGSVSFDTLKENVDEVLDVFKGILTEPAFRQDKLDLAKKQYASLIARRNDDASSIASREISRIVYGKDTPYGWQMEYESLGNIGRDDLMAYHKRYFFPANVTLAIQGDFDVAEMRAKIEKLFADWTVTQPPVPAFPEVHAASPHKVFLADKPDVNQTFLRVAHLSGTLRDPDYPALQVAADILGGSFASRMFKKIRTELGYAYSIGSYWSANYDHPGLFLISGSTKSGTTTETIQAALAEVERIRTEEVTDKELATAKDAILNSFVFNFDSPSQTLRRMVRYDYYGYPSDFIFTYQKAVEAVTKAGVLAAAKKHFQPDDFTIVTVGNQSEFGEPLSALGLPVENIDLTIPQPGQQASAMDDSSLARGKELMATLQQAVGGADKLAAITDVTRISTVQMVTPQGTMTVEQNTQWLAPSTLRQVQKLPFGSMTVYSDGQSGWLSSPQGMQQMPPPVIQQVRGSLLRNPVRLWIADRQEGWTVNAVGQWVVEISDGAGQSVRVELDPTSGLPVKETYSTVQLSGPPSQVEETFSDWREVDGIQFPFATHMTRDGENYADVKLSEIQVNTGLTEAALSAKP